MLRIRLFLAVIVAVTIACSKDPIAPAMPCSRIVSTAPNITELLFELGLGSRVVGVTRYCTWPPDTEKIAKIGGWYDPSPEAIVALKPDTLFHLSEQQQIAEAIKGASIASVALPGKTIEDVTVAARLVGAHCRNEKGAAAFVERFSAALDQATVKKIAPERPRVLLVIGRSPETGPIGTLFVAGKGSFHDAILTRAGGINACDLPLPYPRISAEGVITMNPDLIIELRAHGETQPSSPEDWQRLSSLPAVRDGRVYQLTGDRFFIPGPRIPLLIEELARRIHPETRP